MKNELISLKMQFDLYKKQTNEKIKSLEQGIEMQKETISILLATYEAHMLQQQAFPTSPGVASAHKNFRANSISQSIKNMTNMGGNLRDYTRNAFNYVGSKMGE